MIRFEVTGATPEEFAENARKAWGLLAIGLQQVMSATSPTTSPSPQAMLMPSTSSSGETNGSESSSTASKVYVVRQEVVDFAMEMERRGGLIREKIDERKKLASDKVDDLFVLENPSFEREDPKTGSTTDPQPAKNSKPSSKAKGPKLDDLKTRLSEVIVAATERWDQKRANAYARKLLKGFGVDKLGDLKAEEFEEFLRRADNYVAGTQPE